MARPAGAKNRNYPAVSLRDALEVSRSIQDKASGDAVTRLTLAELLGTTPNSSNFKELLGASRAFGLTVGGINASEFSLTALGDQATGADEVTRDRALRQCVNNVEPYRAFIDNYLNKKVPVAGPMRDFLTSKADVPSERVEECSTRLLEDLRYAGLLRVIQGTEYVSMEGGGSTSRETPPSEPEIDADTDTADLDQTSVLSTEQAAVQGPTAPPASPKPAKKVFIAHGKNREPLQQLKAVLDKFKVQYAVAIDEPNKGRPISLKVAQLMKEECSSAIFIFTADECFERRDEDGQTVEVWRPSENVVYELGAAAILYDRRIVVFKERSVSFPSDFSDLGYIEFDKDDLGRETASLFSELVGLDILEVRAKG